MWIMLLFLTQKSEVGTVGSSTVALEKHLLSPSVDQQVLQSLVKGSKEEASVPPARKHLAELYYCFSMALRPQIIASTT